MGVNQPLRCATADEARPRRLWLRARRRAASVCQACPVRERKPPQQEAERSKCSARRGQAPAAGV